ncbi:hypothetical protein ACLMJK_002548 [Lecanora helva]
MATQNALMVEEVTKPIVLRQRPIPQPAEGEIQIKVTVCGLNPYDFRVRDWGLYVEGRLPVVLGNDIAGLVTKIGPNTTTDLKEGDHIFGQTNYLKQTSDQTGLQEYCLLDAYTVAKIPPNHSDDDGASLVCNIIAPFWAIFGSHGLDLPFPFPGEKVSFDYSKATIVIIGAGSNCGKYAVQVCALAGFGNIIATADASKHGEVLREYGATHVLDRHAKDIEAQIQNLVGDELIYSFDAVNVDHTLGVSILSNTKKGTLACIVPKMAPMGEVGEKKAGFDDKFTQGQSHNQPELGKKFWQCLPGWMEKGKIKSTGWDVLQGLDADKVNEVLDRYRDGKEVKKQVHVHL